MESLTEKRVIEIVMAEMSQFERGLLEIIGKTTTDVIFENNRKIEQDLKDLGILKD